jgi:hypothetical protein
MFFSHERSVIDTKLFFADPDPDPKLGGKWDPDLNK